MPTENLRFRETALVFKVSETADKVEGSEKWLGVCEIGCWLFFRRRRNGRR